MRVPNAAWMLERTTMEGSRSSCTPAMGWEAIRYGIHEKSPVLGWNPAKHSHLYNETSPPSPLLSCAFPILLGNWKKPQNRFSGYTRKDGDGGGVLLHSQKSLCKWNCFIGPHSMSLLMSERTPQGYAFRRCSLEVLCCPMISGKQVLL